MSKQQTISSFFTKKKRKREEDVYDNIKEEEVNLKKKKKEEKKEIIENHSDDIVEEDDINNDEKIKRIKKVKIIGETNYNYSKFEQPKEEEVKGMNGIYYLYFAKTMKEISETSSRIQKTETLTNFFRTIILISPNDLLASIYLCTNQLAPSYEGIELGIGDGVLMKAIAESYGKSVGDVKKMNQKLGDLGSVAEQAKMTQRTLIKMKNLSIQDVYNGFKYISSSSGKSSQKKKIDKIQSLLISGRECEPLFLVRSLQSKLRIGLGEETVLTSISHSIILTNKEIINIEELKKSEEELKIVYSQLPNYDKIIKELLKSGFKNLKKECNLSSGIPVKPMLAKRATQVSELFDKFGDGLFTCEYKYDGERAQIHLNNEKITIFSRNLENNTSKYPDILNIILKSKKENINNFILDCEVVGIKDGKILPFQTLMTRGRKDIKIENIQIKICLFSFDLLYLNGQSLLNESLLKRRQLLYNSFNQIENEFKFATKLDSTNPEEIQSFMNDSIQNLCEGIMVKSLEKDATYFPAKRSMNWLKLKKDYMENGIGDSLDLVPIGAYFGQGKRKGVYGGFLLAIYNSENEEYQSICKIGTGFSDEQLIQFSKEFEIIKEPKSYYKFNDSHKPDIFFDLSKVWEVKCADITLSPKHLAAIGLIDPSKGIALRFPRFIRVRDDKSPEEATNQDEVVDMYQSQSNKVQSNQKNDDLSD
eukprot:gene2423-3134_t